MKAESVLFTGVQKPLNLFGLAPQLFILNAGGAVMAFGVFVALDLVPLALMAAVIAFVVGWTVLFRKTRRDLHFANILFTAPRFWRGRDCRRLIAGRPEDR